MSSLEKPAGRVRRSGGIQDGPYINILLIHASIKIKVYRLDISGKMPDKINNHNQSSLLRFLVFLFPVASFALKNQPFNIKRV